MRRGRKVKKIIELCVLLCASIVYVMFTSGVQISISDTVFVMRLTCEMLRIVLSIGGFLLVYNTMYTKINSRANFIALTSVFFALVLIVGMKCYLFPPYRNMGHGYELYKLILEWLQIGMLFVDIKFIDEKSDMKKWAAGYGGISLLAVFWVLLDFPIVHLLFNDIRVRLISRGIILGVTLFLFTLCHKELTHMPSFQRKSFVRLFGIKILLGAIEIGRVINTHAIISIIQNMLQIIFMMWIVIYIDEVTIGNIWTQVEKGVKNKREQISHKQNEQRTLVVAVEQIKYLIRQMDTKVDELAIKIDNEKYIEKIRNNSNRLLKLSGSILDLNVYEMDNQLPDFQKIDLSELVKNTVESLETYVKQHHIELECIVAKEHIMADVDPNAIERILLNLISNAVKYNKKDGKIQIILSEKRKQIYLCIQDSGIGIASYNLESIFEKFKRGEARSIQGREGSGLGLAIVKSLVELHNGQIKITSGEGKGTLISVTLPIMQEQRKQSERLKIERLSIEDKCKQSFRV